MASRDRSLVSLLGGAILALIFNAASADPLDWPSDREPVPVPLLTDPGGDALSLSAPVPGNIESAPYAGLDVPGPGMALPQTEPVLPLSGHFAAPCLSLNCMCANNPYLRPDGYDDDIFGYLRRRDRRMEQGRRPLGMSLFPELELTPSNPFRALDLFGRNSPYHGPYRGYGYGSRNLVILP